MIILDLSNYKGKTPRWWPENLPKQIRLVEGKYYCKYDIHSIERCKKWYKDMRKKIVELYPNRYNMNWPTGIGNVPPGIEIIITEGGKKP